MVGSSMAGAVRRVLWESAALEPKRGEPRGITAKDIRAKVPGLTSERLGAILSWLESRALIRSWWPTGLAALDSPRKRYLWIGG